MLVALLMAESVQAIIPAPRSLPGHIQRIYVREFRNNSRWFAAQADLTLYVNDEFMSDGRLDVVQSERSDVRLEGTIVKFREYATGLSGDEFPLISTMEMLIKVQLWDPYDPDRLAPLYVYSVPTVIQYISDSRRTIGETQTEARDRLLRQAAKNVVLNVMQGVPEPKSPLDTKIIDNFNKRRGPAQFEPEITQPRFPKPTPPPVGRSRQQD